MVAVGQKPQKPRRGNTQRRPFPKLAFAEKKKEEKQEVFVERWDKRFVCKECKKLTNGQHGEGARPPFGKYLHLTWHLRPIYHGWWLAPGPMDQYSSTLGVICSRQTCFCWEAGHLPLVLKRQLIKKEGGDERLAACIAFQIWWQGSSPEWKMISTGAPAWPG